MEQLISVVMLSHNNGEVLAKSVKSVFNQTYRNWELLFVDDSSKDDTIHQLMILKEGDPRLKITQTVNERGPAVTMNSALKGARGKWVAFINCGDIWEPTKLERQIAFMKRNDCQFSYTCYNVLSKLGQSDGRTISGKEIVTYSDFLKCCWPSFSTVMYDLEVIGVLQIENLKKCNDYALWVNAAKKADCHLMMEPLTTHLSNNIFGLHELGERVKWHYEVFHTELKRNSVVSFFMATRSLWNGMLKKLRYSVRIR